MLLLIPRSAQQAHWVRKLGSQTSMYMSKPGPGASSAAEQEYVQYQIDSLEGREVLNGLVLQQGMHSRLLGGMHLPAHLCMLPL